MNDIAQIITATAAALVALSAEARRWMVAIRKEKRKQLKPPTK